MLKMYIPPFRHLPLLLLLLSAFASISFLHPIVPMEKRIFIHILSFSAIFPLHQLIRVSLPI